MSMTASHPSPFSHVAELGTSGDVTVSSLNVQDAPPVASNEIPAGNAAVTASADDGDDDLFTAVMGS